MTSSPMTIEYITIGIYFAFLLVLGAVFSRFNRNLSDFVRGGARATWWMVGTSILMAGISAFTFTGNASAAFEAGPSFIVIYLANIFGFVLGGLFLARWFRQTRAYTGQDVLRWRFGTPVEQFSVYAGLFLGPFGAAVQLWALAVFVSSVFGFPVGATIVVIGVITLVYSSSGGMWAVMATDVVQGIILFGVTLLMAVLALIEIGGVGRFFEFFSDPRFADAFRFVKEPGQFPESKFGWQWLAAIFAMQMLANINLGAASKYLSVKDGREASRAAWWAAFLMLIGTLVWFIPPMVARFLFEADVMAMDLKNPADASYAVAARHLLPNGLMGVMIAAMFSATMSSMDMGLTHQTGAIMRNLIPRVREWRGLPPMREEIQLPLCRVISIALGMIIISISLVLSVQERFVLFDAFLLIGSVIGVPMAIPSLAGLLIRRLPAWSYFVILGGGLAPSIYSLVQENVFGVKWTIQERSLWVLLFGIGATALCVALRRFSSLKQREREREFFRKMQTPVDFEKEVGVSLDHGQSAIMARTVMVMGAFLLVFLFLPNSPGSRIAIAALALFVILIGVLLQMGTQHERRAARHALEALRERENIEPEAEARR